MTYPEWSVSLRSGTQGRLLRCGGGAKVKLSVVIPARNEEGAVEETVSALLGTLRAEAIPCEIVVVDDGSTDQTARCVRALAAHDSEIRLIQNTGRHGFG